MLRQPVVIQQQSEKYSFYLDPFQGKKAQLLTTLSTGQILSVLAKSVPGVLNGKDCMYLNSKWRLSADDLLQKLFILYQNFM